MLNEFNFLFNNSDIHVYPDPDGNLWFNAPDVAKVLGYRNAPDMLRMIPDNEKLLRTLCVSGQNRAIYLINEMAIYRIAFNSRHPEAVDLQNKVFYDILPCIRKYGAYIDANTRAQLEANPNLIHNINANIDNHEKKRMYHLLHKDSPEHRMMYDNRRLRNDVNNMMGIINYLEGTIDRINSYEDLDLENYHDNIDYGNF